MDMSDDPKRKNPSPAPNHVKLDEDWQEAIGKAIKKPKPAEGWPKPDGDDEGEQPPKP